MPVHKRAGFTLIELLVALVISGILAGVIFQTLQGQSQFVRLQGAREEVQQNSRGALDLIASELRGVAPKGLLNASETSIHIRSPRVWGIVCGQSGTSIDVAVPVLAVDYTANASSRVGAKVQSSTGASPWTGFAVVTDVSGALTPSGCGLTTPPSGVEMRRFTVQNLPTTDDNRTPQQGDLLYYYDFVKYRAAQRPDGTRWILRETDNGNMDEWIAGPLTEPGASDPSLAGEGMKFLYYTPASGNTPLVVVGGGELSAADRDAVDRIRIVVETRSSRRTGSGHQSQLDTATVYLRNRT